MVRRFLTRKSENQMEQRAALMIQAAFRGHMTRKNILATNNGFKQLERKRVISKIQKAVKTIQSYWRGWKIRKIYKEMRLELATRAMQTSYFHQQIELLGYEAYNSFIKTTYRVYPNEFATELSSISNYNELQSMSCIHCVSGQVIVPASTPILVSSCCSPIDCRSPSQQQLKNSKIKCEAVKVSAHSHKQSVNIFRCIGL